MLRVIVPALAISALLATAGAAEPSGPAATGSTTVSPAVVTAPPPPATRAKDRPDEIVCKRLPVSGSRVLGPKTCMARREWKSMEGRGMEDIEAAIRAGRTRNCAGC
ncbi:MAG: hypothetical protein ACOY4K_04150 [Pseudomonadota bacterium]